MANDLTTIDPATACSTLVSTASARAVLDRAFDCTATFTAADIAIVEQVAALVPATLPADDDYVRRSIGSLSAALPAQATGNEGGKLKLKTYQTMLAGCDERALAYACRRCLDELDWMPTVHQLKERIAEWVSPEVAAIARAKAILRAGRRAPADDDAGEVTVADMRQLRERAQAAASSLHGRRVEPVAFDTGKAALEAHQLRIPNKGDYERLFGIDPDTQRAKAEAARLAAEEADSDLLRGALDLHLELHRAA